MWTPTIRVMSSSERPRNHGHEQREFRTEVIHDVIDTGRSLRTVAFGPPAIPLFAQTRIDQEFTRHGRARRWESRMVNVFLHGDHLSLATRDKKQIARDISAVPAVQAPGHDNENEPKREAATKFRHRLRSLKGRLEFPTSPSFHLTPSTRAGLSRHDEKKHSSRHVSQPSRVVGDLSPVWQFTQAQVGERRRMEIAYAVRSDASPEQAVSLEGRFSFKIGCTV
jgi:hypothetical protein